MERKLVLIIDFNNVLYSHYFTKPLSNSKGQNIQAIKGFMFRLKSLRETFNPDYIVICRDMSRARTFRRELYPEYKATRKPINEDILFQSKETIRLLSLMGYPILGNDRYEADDLMGMIARLSNDLGMDALIVSADKDLYQLVNDHTTIWSFRKEEIIDKDYILKNYGLRPDQWIDLKILQGDRSDNIPGIEGIGPKTAEQLMRGFGSIQDIFENMEKLSKSIQVKLRMGKGVIQITRKLVTIVTDYKILDITDKNLLRTMMFPEEVFQTIGELEIPSLTGIIKYDLLPIEKREVQEEC